MQKVHTPFPGIFNLSQIDGNNGFQIYAGEDSVTYSTSLRDVNGDEVGDFFTYSSKIDGSEYYTITLGKKIWGF
jgi:hypothetical protein